MKNRLKILFIAGWYPNKENPTEGIFIQEHAKAISIQNDIIVIYARGNKKIKKLFEIESDKEEHGIRVIRIKYKKINSILSLFLYPWSIYSIYTKFAKENNWKASIIHANTFIAGIPSLLLRFKLKIPYIISEHSSAFARNKLNFIHKILAKYLLNKADIVLPVSLSLKNTLINFGLKSEMNVIPNVIDTKIFKYVDNKIEPIKTITHITNFADVKNTELILKSVNILKERRNDFKVNIIGNGPNKNKYQSQVNSMGLNNYIKFLGRLDKYQISLELQKSAFYIQASNYETFGVSLLEAMACGKPVVVTSIDTFKEKITDTNGIIVNNNEANEYTKVISYMIDNFDKYDSKLISKLVHDNYSFDIIGNKITTIYQKLLFS